jgi:hypothetical protein
LIFEKVEGTEMELAILIAVVLCILTWIRKLKSIQLGMLRVDFHPSTRIVPCVSYEPTQLDEGSNARRLEEADSTRR